MKMPYEVPQLQLLAANPNDGTLIIGASGGDVNTQSEEDAQNAVVFNLDNAAL